MVSINFVVSTNIDQKDFRLAYKLKDYPTIKANTKCPKPFKPARQFMSSQAWLKRIFCKHFDSAPKSALEFSVVLYFLAVNSLKTLIPRYLNHFPDPCIILLHYR